jgi:hypothetical protein
VTPCEICIDQEVFSRKPRIFFSTTFRRPFQKSLPTMSGEWFECVCQFFRAQSANLSTVMQGLSNQNTISDIGGGSGDLQLPHQAGPFANVSPMHLFMVFLAMLWAWMYIFSKQNKIDEKPTNGNSGDGGGGDAPGGGDGGGAGMAH